MNKQYDVFDEEYVEKSSTDVIGKITVIKKEEEKQQNQTVTGQKDYDKAKPYRVTIRAQEIKQ